MKPPFEGFIPMKYPRGSITQGFGENALLYSRWGLKYHNGVDLVAPHGTPLLAVEDATVIDVKSNPEGYGKYVRLMSKTPVGDIYNEWTYGHCDTITVKLGDKVKAGQQISTMGNTGFVVSGKNVWWGDNQPKDGSGTHLHLGVRKLKKDKLGFQYTKTSPRMIVLDYDNGVHGCVDPLQFFASPDLSVQLSIIEKLKKIIELYKELNKIK